MSLEHATTISVVIPAHNEEAYIGQCLQSVRLAAAHVACTVEIVVCLNNCTDKTEEIARHYEAVVCHEEEACVAKVRNTAIEKSTGSVIVTLDADTCLSENYLANALKMLATGRYQAGASLMLLDRLTLTTALFGSLIVMPVLLLLKFSGGMFWMTRDVYQQVGGFNTQKLTGEDFEFWYSLKRQVKENGKKFGMLKTAWVKTSARKLDEFGPWFMITHPHWYYHAIKGTNRAFADQYLYKTSRSHRITDEQE